jgi:hypothetical protein
VSPRGPQKLWVRRCQVVHTSFGSGLLVSQVRCCHLAGARVTLPPCRGRLQCYHVVMLCMEGLAPQSTCRGPSFQGEASSDIVYAHVAEWAEGHYLKEICRILTIALTHLL